MKPEGEVSQRLTHTRRRDSAHWSKASNLRNGPGVLQDAVLFLSNIFGSSNDLPPLTKNKQIDDLAGFIFYPILETFFSPSPRVVLTQSVAPWCSESVL